MNHTNKPQPIALGSARRLTRTVFAGDRTELETPIMFREKA
ncbi:hypothetical protein [Sphingomonas sp. M1-B02]|nr:hypothetical protein [Sphingomonas sp. S6-11]UZK67852.1 hypothetical protein OKW87_08540 [Sphingomonas sp. S6-11]